MPLTVQLFRILLAAPSDVTEEHRVVDGIVRDWNIQNGDRAGARLELMSWTTHAHPASGRRPQALINRQFADQADIVIGVFWRKFGSPTGKAASGTVEEVERAVRRRKKVMVYFSQRKDAGQGATNPRENKRIEQFKLRFGHRALYGGYADSSEFERTLRKDLALVMNEVAASKRKRER